MKATILIAILSTGVCASSFAQDSMEDVDIAHLPKFIRTLPTHEEAEHDKDIAIHYNVPETDNSKKQRQEARARIEKTMAAYDQLYRLLHVGATVFDYPGLLSLSRDHDVYDNGGYSITLGVFLIRGSNERHFISQYRVYFNKTGIITRIQKMNYFPSM